MKNEEKLKARIVELSQADNFDEAKSEWFLKCIYKGESVCLCGKNPIHKICVIRNKHNYAETIVGSSCVEKFIGIKSQKLFASFNSIAENIESYLLRELIDYLYEQEVITGWEREFLLSTVGKKFSRLTEKQKAKRVQLNEKVIKYMSRNGETYE